MLKLNLIIVCLAALSSLALTVPVEKAKEKRTPTLLISLDGMRADKLREHFDENPLSYIKRYFVEEGVLADHLQPSFPTLTFPNHYSLVTGLYQEGHGVVGNTIWDPATQKKINYLDNSVDSKNVVYWNGADPIWLTAKNQGLKTASFFWTGSEVWTRHPDVFLPYTNTFQYYSRCEEVVNWFTKFEMDFVTLYFNEPDNTGHSFGPDSKQYKDKVGDVDETIGYCIQLLLRANLLDKINMVIVSDHGMATMKGVTVIPNTLVNTALINATRTVYGIVSNVHPVNESVKLTVFNGLNASPYLDCYLKEDIPSRLNFQNNDRIAPIVCIAQEGYVMNTVVQTLTANHGFDNTLDSMKAVFLARGPDFKENVKIGMVKNVDVYPLLCELTLVKCNPNNGTLTPFLNAITFTPSIFKN